jgi:magnesium-transporting ATPase (P-type)
MLSPLRWRLAVGGIATGTAAFAAFLIGDADGNATAQTMAFTTVVFAQLGYVYAVRGDGFFLRAKANWSLNAAVALSALVAAAALALAPLREAFSTVALSPGQLAAALALATAPLVATEILKAWQRRAGEDVRC